MKIIEKEIEIIEKNIPDNSIFLDIETTGFNRLNSRIYLMGTLAKEGNNYIFRQFLTQNKTEEKELIERTIDLLKNYDSIITFNGENFDLPFIQKRAQRYSFNFNYKSLNSLDIFKEIRYKSFLMDFENLKLKTIEKYLGINREDLFSGGELIQLYYQYESGDSKLENVLSLHNEEDVINMPKLLAIFDRIRDTNRIVINDYLFDVDGISLNKKTLKISGNSNIPKAYFNLLSTELTVIDNRFKLNSLVRVDNYDKNIKCSYIEKHGLDLKCNYNYKTPKEILLIKYDKEILYKNAFDFFKRYLENIF